jgi:hypothetical protein
MKFSWSSDGNIDIYFSQPCWAFMWSFGSQKKNIIMLPLLIFFFNLLEIRFWQSDHHDAIIDLFFNLFEIRFWQSDHHDANVDLFSQPCGVFRRTSCERT